MKMQTIVLKVTFNPEETYAKSAAEAISHSLYNEEGIKDLDYRVLNEQEIKAELELADMIKANRIAEEEM